MCLAAVGCRVDSYARHAHRSIYAVQWTHICSPACQMPTAAYMLCNACPAMPCQLPNAHCLHFLCATALLGILTPHTFSTNSTEVENKKSAGPLVWRGGEREWVLGNSLAGNKPSANQPQPSFKSSSHGSFYILSYKEMLMTQIVWVTNILICP